MDGVRRKAVGRARAAMMLSGHPDLSWSIMVEAALTAPPDPGAADRLAAALDPLPSLGPPPSVLATDGAGLANARRAFADEPYVDGGPVVRVAIVQPPSPAVLVAAHHGAVDGLGLLALLAVVLGSPVTSSARGLGGRPSRGSFAGTMLRRLAEAAFDPPARISPAVRRRADAGDELCALDTAALAGGTAALVSAAVRAVGRWNGAHPGRMRGPLVVAVGSSRRPGDRLTPGEDSAYLRIRLKSARPSYVQELLDAAVPQPSAPPLRSLGPLGPLVRGLSHRLGSTVLVSNLGRATGPPELRSIAFYPVSHGRSGVSVGAATVGELTTLTVRARRRDFDPRGAAAFLGMVADALATARPPA